ncbi:MAG: hypothetical protein LBN39_09365, partial [Planctomycetaceae bacterium]|nr:hypothetical protein [Planctomycetaceae bacterium]
MKYFPRKRSEQNKNTATLFPFLAVLLCTMGALIMLLVLIARNVQAGNAQENYGREDVFPASAVDTTEQLAQLDEGIEEAKWFQENFQTTKKENLEKLTEAKTRLSLAEKETQKVQDEIKRLMYLEQEIGKTEKLNVNGITALRNTVEQRKETLNKETLELAELQKKAGEDAKSYAIIPYRGKSGTHRRPIYIECRNNKVIIQPEGVELYESDFQLSDRPDNPFDAVLRVIRQYYIETEQIVRGTEPYPLLVVRPSGTEAYGGVRQAIGSWIADYGYELVNEDWKVEYPAPSAELKERIEKQLEISRMRLAGYLAAMRAAGELQQPQRQYRLNPQGQTQVLGGEREKLFSRETPPPVMRYGERPVSDPDISLTSEEQKNTGSTDTFRRTTP